MAADYLIVKLQPNFNQEDLVTVDDYFKEKATLIWHVVSKPSNVYKLQLLPRIMDENYHSLMTLFDEVRDFLVTKPFVVVCHPDAVFDMVSFSDDTIGAVEDIL
jgi:hypothetical protein